MNKLIDYTGIVIDSGHKKFGEWVEILEHRPKDGMFAVKFANRSCADLHDGVNNADIFPPQVIVLNIKEDARRIDSLTRTLPSARRLLEDHFAIIAEGRLHRLVQLAAKAAIKEIVKQLGSA